MSARKKVHIRKNGLMTVTRLWDDGGEVLHFDSGGGWVNRLDLVRRGEKVHPGWPLTATHRDDLRCAPSLHEVLAVLGLHSDGNAVLDGDEEVVLVLKGAQTAKLTWMWLRDTHLPELGVTVRRMDEWFHSGKLPEHLNAVVSQREVLRQASRAELTTYLESRGFAVYESESEADLRRAAMLDVTVFGTEEGT